MKIDKLKRDFFLRNTKVVAKDLIGKVLVRIKNGRVYSGIIVETEAYLGRKDPASHSFRGITKRNEVMFKGGGNAYVYFTYGNHYCFNVVTCIEGKGEAVLIRAVEPVSGVEYMKKNRNTNDIYNLTNGPGKLAQAMEIDRSVNGESLEGNLIFITGNENGKYKKKTSPRIGITKNAAAHLRYFAEENPFVSGKNYKFKIHPGDSSR